MIDALDLELSIMSQCQLLNISQSSFYYKPKPIFAENLDLMRLIDEQYLKTPSWGSGSMINHLGKLGQKINRKKVQRLMRLMGLEAIDPGLRPAVLISNISCFLICLENLKSTAPIRYGWLI